MNSISLIFTTKQDTQDGKTNMSGKNLDNYIRNLINEYATYRNGCYAIDVDDISKQDKIIFLSRLTDPSEYEYYCDNQTRLAEGLNEYKSYMQELLDYNIDDVWHDNMRDMGGVLKIYPDNGEIYYA
jgi:hypothetical protein